MRPLIVGVSGASGAPYARRLLQVLGRTEIPLHVVVTGPAREVIADELGITRFSLEALADGPLPNATLYAERNIGARIASGSFQTAGMVICPCSSHTLAAIANGLADNLLTRAALVTMKEARRLILVPREMPLSAIEIENMLRLSRSGVILCPACPGFYMRPTTIDELLDFVVGRVLDLLDIKHGLNTRWDPAAARRGDGNAER